MNTHHNVRAPSFKQSNHVSNRTLVEELPSFGSDSIHAPVEVFHPVLAVTEDPVIEMNKSAGKVMRFFDSFDDANGVRLALQEFLHTRDDC